MHLMLDPAMPLGQRRAAHAGFVRRLDVASLQRD
jgi:hypothetical protein